MKTKSAFLLASATSSFVSKTASLSTRKRTLATSNLFATTECKEGENKIPATSNKKKRSVDDKDEASVETLAQQYVSQDEADSTKRFGTTVSFNIDDPSLPLTSTYTSNMESESTFVEFTPDGRCVPAGPVGQTKEKIGNFLSQPRVEVAICAMVLLNSLLVAVSTLQSLTPETSLFIRYSQETVGIVLALEFLGRWFSSSKEPGRHVLDPRFANDIVAVLLPVLFSSTPRSFWINSPLPDWLTSPSGLFNLQLFRVFRLSRVIESKETFKRFEQALNIPLKEDVQEWQLQLARVLLSLFTLLSVATGLIYTAEHDVNPDIPDYFTALYFGLTSLTTVGFGDITPVTVGGRFVVCGSIIAGVAVVPAQAAALVEALLARQASRRPKKRVPSEMRAMNSFSNKELDTSLTCENCGSSLHWVEARFCYYCGEDL